MNTSITTMTEWLRRSIDSQRNRSTLHRLVLVREWQGTTHQVTVLSDGYGWNGQHHPSLSGIAQAITGTKWNGPRFFGLREANHAD